MTPPNALRSFWKQDRPLSLDNGAEVLDEEDFEDINDPAALDCEWELAVKPVVAVDGGLGYFVLDDDGAWNGAAGAIWWVERSDLSAETAYVVAESFDAFVTMTSDEVDHRWAT